MERIDGRMRVLEIVGGGSGGIVSSLLGTTGRIILGDLFVLEIGILLWGAHGVGWVSLGRCEEGVVSGA